MGTNRVAKCAISIRMESNEYLQDYKYVRKLLKRGADLIATQRRDVPIRKERELVRRRATDTQLHQLEPRVLRCMGSKCQESATAEETNEEGFSRLFSERCF